MWKAGYAIAELKAQGQQMKFFDTGIAATISARCDKLLVLDSDFESVEGPYPTAASASESFGLKANV